MKDTEEFINRKFLVTVAHLKGGNKIWTSENILLGKRRSINQ